MDLRISEIEHQFIQDRIKSVEYLMYQLAVHFSSYNRKKAHQRDSGDKLAKVMLRLAANEFLNPTIQHSLGEFSDIFKAIQDYREAQIQRIDYKVILEFSAYDEICKQVKQQLKKSYAIQAEELKKRNQLEKVRSKKQADWKQISEAEQIANRARTATNLASQDLYEQIDKFEKKKIDDLKRTFLNFVKIELQFHAKALELYTRAYQVIDAINPDVDIKEFRTRLKFPHTYIPPVSCSLLNRQEMVGDASNSQEMAGDASNVQLTTPSKLQQPSRSEGEVSISAFVNRSTILSAIPECSASPISDASNDSSASESTSDSKPSSNRLKVLNSRKK